MMGTRYHLAKLSLPWAQYAKTAETDDVSIGGGDAKPDHICVIGVDADRADCLRSNRIRPIAAFNPTIVLDNPICSNSSRDSPSRRTGGKAGLCGLGKGQSLSSA